MTTSNDKKKHKLGFAGYLTIAAVILGILGTIANHQTPKENYNDNSTTHQILAKNYLKEYIKDNLKDAKSYEEISYTSNYSSSDGCYKVSLRYRAKNSFGALVAEQASGDVYFNGDNVSIRNVHTE